MNISYAVVRFCTRLMFLLLFFPLAVHAGSDAVALYSFDEGAGNVLRDLSGHGNAGTLTNEPAWADGKYGKALSFDGTKKYVNIADNASLAFGSGDYTISAWVYPRTLDGVAFLGKYGSTGNGWLLSFSPSGRLQFQANGGSSYTGAELVKINQWMHVAVVKSGSSLKLYLNAIDRTVFGVAPASVDNTEPLQIGTTVQPPSGGCCQLYANAVVDDVRIYRRALTQPEMQSDMETVVADTAAPSVPGNLVANVLSTSEIQLAWSASIDNLGVAGYKILRDGAPLASVGTTAYKDGGLAPNTAYSYAVLAYDAAGNTSQATPAVQARTQSVFDFSLSNGGARSAVAGSSVTNTVTATLGGGASQSVSFTATGLPAGAAATFNPISCGLTCAATITLKTAGTTPPGTYQINIGATAGTVTRSTSFLLTVTAPSFDFTLQNGGARSVSAGQSVATTVSASLLSGLAQSIAFSTTGLPAGASASYSASSCTPACTSTLTVQTGGTVAGGTYPIAVVATGGGVTHGTSFTLTVTAAAPGGTEPSVPPLDFMPSNYAGKHVIAYAKGANSPDDFIGIEVSGQVPLLLSLTQDRHNAPVAPTTEQIVYLVDGIPVSPVLSSPFAFTWDSTKVADGNHVLSALLVDGPSDLASYSVEPAVIVVDNNPGPVTAAQRVPSIGISHQSMRLASATPDWVTFPAGRQPPHGAAHPYPYQAVPPAHALADPAKALVQANWVLEALNVANTGLYSGRPRYFQTKGGHVVSKQHNTQAGSTSEFAAPFLRQHGGFDGPRDDNAVSMYSTFVPEPNGPNWLGIDLSGRLFRVFADGAVATLAGPVTKRDFLPYDIVDQTISAATRDQMQMEVKGNFDGGRLFKLSTDLAIDPRNANIVYVADAGNRRIAKVDLSVVPAQVSTFAGSGMSGTQDGPSAGATFVEPWSIAMASDGTLYVADRGGNAIRKISADGAMVSTVVNAANGITAPFVIRLDSQGNIILGENKTALVKRIAPLAKTVSNVATACASEWMWLDVDRKANIGPKDDMLVICGTGGNGNTVMLRISADGTRNSQVLDGNGGRQQGNVTYVQDAHGHYPWIVAIDDEEARIMTGGFGDTGLHMLRMSLPGDASLTGYDGALYSQGREIFRRGTVVGFPFGARPSFTSLLGETGHGYLGLKNFDDLIGYTDAELIAYIQAGMGGAVPRPEITGKDMRALLYYVRNNMLTAMTQLPVPMALPTDKTPAVIANVTVTPIDATTARITWTTDEPTIGFVEFGPNLAYHRWSDIESGYATSHSQLLKFLPAGKTIHFAIRAKDEAGNQTLTADRTFTASGNSVPLPTLVLSATPASIAPGKTATIAWTASDASACNASGAWSGTKALSGTMTTAALSATATYTLTCTSSTGSVAKSVTVSVGSAQAPTLTLTTPIPGATVAGNPLTVTYGKSGDLSAVHHVNLQLDANPEVSDTDFDGVYQFAAVNPGAHTVRAYLATEANTMVAGTAAVQVSFTVATATLEKVSAVRSGLWSAGTTWSSGKPPSALSEVKISGAITVEYDLPFNDNPAAEAASITIDNGAVLRFSRTQSTRLDLDGSLSILSGGLLDMGSPQNPIPANLSAYLGFNVASDRLFASPTAASPLPTDPAYHPEDTGLWITSGGKITINGAPKPAIWYRLAQTAPAGSATLTLSGTPAGFRIGDKVVLTPSGSGAKETEVRTITAIAGNTLTLNAPLAYQHEGQRYALNTQTGVARPIADSVAPGTNETAVEVRSEVGLLTQNVVVASNLVKQGDTNHRAHTIFLHGSTGTFAYAEFRDLGPRAKKGRYPIHLHLTGDSSIYVVQGVSVWNQFEPGNKWVVLHMSQDAIVKDSVGYNAQGRGYYLEDGTEANNTVENNLGVGVYGPEEVPNTTAIAALQQLTRPAVFWVRMNNTIKNNVATGGDVDVSGYWITPAIVPGPATVFEGNEARGNAFGLYFSGGEQFNPTLGGSRLIRNDVAVWADSFVNPTLRNTLFYGNRDLGITLANTSGSVITSDPSAGTPAQPPAGVPVLTFTASSLSVKSGGSVTLSWNARNATECDASGDWSGTQPASGSFVTAALSNARTFGLICRNAAGAATGSVRIAIEAASVFMPGKRITLAVAAEVRAMPASSVVTIPGTTMSNLLGTQAAGSAGSIIGGPKIADGATWWNIDFDSGIDGWSTETGLQAGSADATAPGIPTGLNVQAVSAGQINLAWVRSTDNVAAGVVRFDILRNGVQIASTASTNYQDSGLNPNTAYSYTVRARDIAGNVSAVSAAQTATTPTPPSASPLDGVAAGTWYRVPNSRVGDIQFNWPSSIFWGSGPPRYMTESSGAYDSARNRFLLWGGGHNDYAGNEIYAFDLNTLAWRRETEPALYTDPKSTVEAAGYYPDANGDVDLQQPRSRHTYDSLQYVPPLDSLCAFGMMAGYPASKGAFHTDCFNFSTRRWDRKADIPSAGQSLVAMSAYDPLTRHAFYLRGAGYLAEFDPIANTWTRRSDNDAGYFYDATAIIDTKRHRFVAMGMNQLIYYDLNTSGQLTQQRVADRLTGATDILKARRPGFAYDAVNDVYVLWSGEFGSSKNDGVIDVSLPPENVYVIDPDTWVAKAVVPAPGNMDKPRSPFALVNGFSNSTFGRFAYLPAKNLFMLVNNRTDEDVFFYKLDPVQVRSALGR